MNIDYIPTLQVLRELYDKPRDMARFWWYLQQMLGGDEDGELDVVVPITTANPMGREHCLAAVNALLAIDAETVAQSAFEEGAASFPDVSHTVRAAVTLLDDIGGGWTNRYLTEAAIRMCSDPRAVRANQKRRFVLAVFWTSEFVEHSPVSEQTGMINLDDVGAEACISLYRYAHLQRHGTPSTLAQIMRMDGMARAFAGHTPQLGQDELDYTAAAIAPLLESTDFGVQFACLFGDEAARSVGYTPQGLAPYAGFELALAQALQFDD